MSLDKIAASVFGLSQEASLALANLRFDFSLVKVEAPSEFQGLGLELTSSRKKAAEDGTLHITARKLGALFQHVLPPTPALIRAYGKRATEIASCRDFKPRGSRAQDLFADHVGIDGTSIWAAATSGPEAISVHLLACMLARMWSVPEAISIWVELVAQRKRELDAVGETEALYLEAGAASSISVSREQLAEWDASARAWLRSADQAMGAKQKQLILILNSIDIPVNKHPTLYQGVLDAWKSSMTAADRLVDGMPASIQNGSILLGLASWHLYPDMLVLGKSQVEVKQNDSVVATGGILTIGLNIKSQGSAGVYWSLPLSHLRYYGRAVVSERSLETQANRLTIDQLFLVAIGFLTKQWAMSASQVAESLGRLWECISGVAKHCCAPGTPHWLGLFARSSLPLLDADGLGKKEAAQLMRFGERRVSQFVCTNTSRNADSPLFGLASFEAFFVILTLEGKVRLLRDIVARKRHPRNAHFIIRYGKPPQEKNQQLAAQWEYATARPIARASVRRKADGTPIKTSGHTRWLLKVTESSEAAFEVLGETVDRVEAIGPFAYPQVEHSFSLLSAGDLGVFASSNFRFVAGDDEVGLFSDVDIDDYEAGSTPVDPSSIIFGFEEWKQYLSRDWVSPVKCASYLYDYLEDDNRSATNTSFRALATMANIYKLLPDATIPLDVTSQPLYMMPWVDEGLTSGPVGLFSTLSSDWARTFSCIAQMESGSLAILPSMLERVMAMAVGDSLYVAAPLLCDPTEAPGRFEVQRITGNVGKPGIAMLIPPADPQMQEYDPSSWKLVNHEPYDGRLENSFQSTSAHLSFTGYTLPLDSNNRGYRDNEIYFMEARITVHDRGQEIGDLDILRHLENDKFRRVASCDHDTSDAQTRNDEVIGNAKLTMIDNWAELLDRPETVAVARSNGNWLGRLALTVVSLQSGLQTVVTPNKFCWKCITEEVKRHALPERPSRIVPGTARSGSNGSVEHVEGDLSLPVHGDAAAAAPRVPDATTVRDEDMFDGLDDQNFYLPRNHLPMEHWMLGSKEDPPEDVPARRPLWDEDLQGVPEITSTKRAESPDNMLDAMTKMNMVIIC